MHLVLYGDLEPKETYFFLHDEDRHTTIKMMYAICIAAVTFIRSIGRITKRRFFSLETLVCTSQVSNSAEPSDIGQGILNQII